MRRIGLIINPIAGMGGAVGLKGTDGQLEEACRRGARPRAPLRASEAMALFSQRCPGVTVFTAGGDMGAGVLAQVGVGHEVVYEPGDARTSASDTHAAAAAMCERGVDCIVFCGGDGTARDILAATEGRVPILGIPAGVKMYSSVFAISTHAAAEVLAAYVSGSASIREAAILDIDEEKYRKGTLDRSLFGYAPTPYVPRMVQAPKCAYYTEGENEAKAHIARFASEFMADGSLYILGVGSTTRAIADALGIEKTLLGIDLVKDGRLVCKDAAERDILAYLAQGTPAKVIVSPLGAQGFIFGRGNHQISAEVLRCVGRDNIIVVGTPHKLQETPHFYVDTGDATVDEMLRGAHSVVCGYRLAARKFVS
jgi:predicted polyphosphate/ATP-dependent NAD kinase